MKVAAAAYSDAEAEATATLFMGECSCNDAYISGLEMAPAPVAYKDAVAATAAATPKGCSSSCKRRMKKEGGAW